MIIEIDKQMTFEIILEKIQKVTKKNNAQWQKEKEKALNAIFNSKTFKEDPLTIQHRMRQ